MPLPPTGKITSADSFQELLRSIPETSNHRYLALRIVSESISGRLGIRDNAIIVGGENFGTGETGEAAVNQLLSVTRGIYTMLPIESAIDFVPLEQGLQVQLGSVITTQQMKVFNADPEPNEIPQADEHESPLVTFRRAALTTWRNLRRLAPLPKPQKLSVEQLRAMKSTMEELPQQPQPTNSGAVVAMTTVVCLAIAAGSWFAIASGKKKPIRAEFTNPSIVRQSAMDGINAQKSGQFLQSQRKLAPLVAYNTLPADLRAPAYQSLAQDYLETSDNLNAIETFTEAIALSTNSAQLYLGRARAYERSGDIDKAISDFSKAEQLAPSNSEAKDGLSRHHFRSTSR